MKLFRCPLCSAERWSDRRLPSCNHNQEEEGVPIPTTVMDETVHEQAEKDCEKPNPFLSKIQDLKYDLQTLKNWLDYCLRNQDWHGVMDAAADIRELEAKIEVLNEVHSSF